MNYPNLVACPQCGGKMIVIKSKPFSFRSSYGCKKCSFKGWLPLRPSEKIVYFSVIVIAILRAGGVLANSSGFATVLGGLISIYSLVSAYILFKEWQMNKKIKQYRTTNKLGVIEQDPWRNDEYVRVGLIWLIAIYLFL